MNIIPLEILENILIFVDDPRVRIICQIWKCIIEQKKYILSTSNKKNVPINLLYHLQERTYNLFNVRDFQKTLYYDKYQIILIASWVANYLDYLCVKVIDNFRGIYIYQSSLKTYAQTYLTYNYTNIHHEIKKKGKYNSDFLVGEIRAGHRILFEYFVDQDKLVILQNNL